MRTGVQWNRADKCWVKVRASTSMFQSGGEDDDDGGHGGDMILAHRQ